MIKNAFIKKSLQTPSRCSLAWSENRDDTIARAAPDVKKEPLVQISGIPFAITDWSLVEQTEHTGESGMAYWRTRDFGGIRVRMVEYTPGYRADHWCAKGHILLCIEGQLETQLKDGRTFTLKPGMSYQVADNSEPHRSFTKVGAKLFVID